MSTRSCCTTCVLKASPWRLAGGDGIRVAPARALTNEHRQAIRAHRAELLALLHSAGAPSASPTRSHQQADRCCRPTWSEPEIASFSARVLLFVRRGIDPTAAPDIGERLVLRDRDSDDRRLCAECVRRSGTMPCGSRRPTTERRSASPAPDDCASAMRRNPTSRGAGAMTADCAHPRHLARGQGINAVRSSHG